MGEEVGALPAEVPGPLREELGGLQRQIKVLLHNHKVSTQASNHPFLLLKMFPSCRAPLKCSKGTCNILAKTKIQLFFYCSSPFVSKNSINRTLQ